MKEIQKIVAKLMTPDPTNRLPGDALIRETVFASTNFLPNSKKSSHRTCIELVSDDETEVAEVIQEEGHESRVTNMLTN